MLKGLDIANVWRRTGRRGSAWAPGPPCRGVINPVAFANVTQGGTCAVWYNDARLPSIAFPTGPVLFLLGQGPSYFGVMLLGLSQIWDLQWGQATGRLMAEFHVWPHRWQACPQICTGHVVVVMLEPYLTPVVYVKGFLTQGSLVHRWPQISPA